MKQAHPRGTNVSLREEWRVIYDEFKTEVRRASEGGGSSGGLVAIPSLRRTIGMAVSRDDFDAFVMRLHADGLVHLMSHVDPDSLAEETIADCLCDDTGLLLYWLRWL
jgi:hypothetical protein